MSPYGSVKCDSVIYDDSGDQTLALNNVATKASPSFSGTITSTAALNQTGAFTQVGEFDINGQYNQTIPTGLATTGAVTVDASLGNYFTLGAMTGNITGFTFTNLPASGKAYTFTIELTPSSTPHTVTWTPTVGGATKNWYWSGTAPTLEASKPILVNVVTDDGGEKFRAISSKAFTA
tara:strand:+ start:749 stop:1282 length:534 start_codon:yes stop_codon:yes gene_type:complete